MVRCRVSVQFEPGFEAVLERDWLERLACASFEREGGDQELALGLVIAGDDQVRALNRDFRRRDEVTDVLSFPLAPDPEFILPPGEAGALGEVVLSYPRAEAQAAEHGCSVEEEVARLVVHGVLHLNGYDHETPEEEARMRAREDEVLARLEMAS